ncbi:cupin domain-containing protein [Pedobacter paludis]|uniref:Cupin domain-containing protein n=1 Tax=Pedobacter paludis TaxID=2203212 RepID=A0A317F0J4_9SPHI|nr:cupin domain-containing protein [Pedobacter paludis]PWS30996.1 cupin domain-containing protein [Pedobacter paludis]
MKRKSFFQILAGLAIFPSVALSRVVNTLKINKGFMVPSGADRNKKPINLFEGDTFYTKVSAKDTDGSLYIYESTRVKKGGPALHYHYDQDETWYVLEGAFLIKVGEEIYNAKVGDTVFGPRGVPHAFAKLGEGNGKLLMTFQPAGKMEEFFINVSEGKMKGLSLQQQDEFRKNHGFVVVGPAIDYQKKP